MLKKLKITQNKREERRLGFVKALKDITGLGLKDTKELSDILHNGFNGQAYPHTFPTPPLKDNPYTIEVPLDDGKTHDDVRKFIKFLNDECTGDYDIIGGAEWERDIKLLSLGIGTNDEYREMIKRLLMYGSQEKMESFIDDMLVESNRENLEKVYNKLIIEK